MKSAFPTFEYASIGTAVVAGDMPTAATGLRSVPGVNHGYHTTPFLGLVRDKTLELGERPGVHPALGRRSPLCLHPLSDVFEIFQHDRAPWLDSPLDLLTEHMVTITADRALHMHILAYNPVVCNTNVRTRRSTPSLKREVAAPW